MRALSVGAGRRPRTLARGPAAAQSVR